MHPSTLVLNPLGSNREVCYTYLNQALITSKQTSDSAYPEILVSYPFSPIREYWLCLGNRALTVSKLASDFAYPSTIISSLSDISYFLVKQVPIVSELTSGLGIWRH